MDQTSFSKFSTEGNWGLNSSENVFQTFQNEESITVQKRRSYLMEMNEDFDIQQVFKEISWNQGHIE